ncbi:hypothetical protein [Bowmanella sp. JS7-9]|uniref:Uncharacterized protein n=1 Tax=Pseudobowmanella zhangzhouensis TaxID=1537679 RepID=A0ABW1XKA4_9ALTE|nr:hypothetical protein [Bowmanella sp. JS7-9]TBX20554.1 hypothetical protein TK45_14665 [Bowmanella sp. JS7-9]
MEKKAAEKILEELAIISVNIEKLSKKVSVENRKLFSKDLGSLMKACCAIESEIGFIVPELHPHYLGWENYSNLRKKHEDPNFPIDFPSTQQLQDACEQWDRIKKAKNL